MPCFNPNKCPSVLLLDLSMLLLLTGLLGILTFSVLVAALYPQSLIFLGGLVPKMYLTFPVWIIVTIFHIYIYAAIFSGAAIAVAINLIYWFYLYICINRELRLGAKKYWSNSSLRCSGTIRITYRAFQIVHHSLLLECQFGIYLVWFNGFLQFLAIFISFVLVEYWKALGPISKVPLVIGLVMLNIVCSLFYEIGGRLQKACMRTIASWKNYSWGSTRENRIMGKFCKSCMPLLMCYGRQLVVNSKSLLTFHKSVTRGTVRALLMSR